MSDEQQFSPGDRVRVVYSVGGVLPGTRGTIAYAFLLAPLYQVCFDGDTIPHLVARHKLAPDVPEPANAADAGR